MRLSAICTSAAMSLLAASAANAADIGAKSGGGLKDVPYVETPWNWGGFYYGGTIGYGSGTSRNKVTANGNDEHGWANNDPDGLVLGGAVGYNHMIAPTWLIGAETDFSWMDVSGDQGKVVYDGHGWTGGWDALFTLRGRIGYTMGRTLFYGTGGYAAMHTNETISGNNANESNYGTGWRNGWVVGGGIEHMFTDRLSGKIEYLHAEFETLSGETGFPGNMGNQFYKLESDLDLVRVGLNYKFY